MGRWITLSEAGVLFNRSPRTVERWIEVGKLQVRHSPTGREVWIEQDAEQPSDDTTETAADTADTMTVGPDTADMLPTLHRDRVLELAERAVGAMSVRTDTDLRRTRRWAVGGWSVVGLLAVVAAVAIAYSATRMQVAQDQAADAARTAADRLADMADRMTKAESRAVAATTEARQSQERAVLLEQQLTEASASVEISLAKQQAAERERDAVRQLLNTRQVAAAEANDDVPGGGVTGQQ